ncbi:MAG: NAD(P)/FAD-dependent oxidoreductase [Kiritimatiellales bacterium]|nr:NAD(P)/FAD-dependent oxidoreductase [Kiritimatiellales bacterium]MCF7863463.1 NAD(P)/FAD-dependent oxidoreductase [Kiritimatiellales bacterium]
MRLRINQVAVRLAYGENDVLKAVCRELRCKKELLGNIEILRRSLDARKKDQEPRYILSVEVDYSGRPPMIKPGQLEKAPDPEPPLVFPAIGTVEHPPVVIGAGPAGLMAALMLAEAGRKPLLIERGAETPDRSRQVEAFWKDGLLDVESNVLYGEGGAGLFSDGKLTARSKDRARIRRFFETLVSCGASPDILFDAMPHIGTDDLTHIIPAIRNRIWELGGACAFNSRLEGLKIENGALRGIVASGKEIRTDACFLATGHSARDIYGMLYQHHVPLEAKPFAVGVRLEVPQQRIDEAQYGKWAKLPMLGSASFRLTRKEEGNARRCYSFCMCPGGLVISCASSEGLITSNGMSLSARDKPFGNAAFLVPIEVSDFPTTGNPLLAGIEFQTRMEKAAFDAGGGNYGLPAARLIDFLERKKGGLPAERSCLQSTPALLQDLLPEFVSQTLESAIPNMLRELNRTPLEEAILYTSETRSSSPVRIVRNDMGESTGVKGLYPCGEGAGYSGGIVSSALDGMRAVEQFLFKEPRGDV